MPLGELSASALPKTKYQLSVILQQGTCLIDNSLTQLLLKASIVICTKNRNSVKRRIPCMLPKHLQNPFLRQRFTDILVTKQQLFSILILLDNAPADIVSFGKLWVHKRIQKPGHNLHIRLVFLCKSKGNSAIVKTRRTAACQKVFQAHAIVLIVPGRVHAVPLPVFHLHIVPHMRALASRYSSLSNHQCTGDLPLLAENLKGLGITLTDHLIFSVVSQEHGGRRMGIPVTLTAQIIAGFRIIGQLFAEVRVNGFHQLIPVFLIRPGSIHFCLNLRFCFLYGRIISRYLAGSTLVEFSSGFELNVGNVGFSCLTAIFHSIGQAHTLHPENRRIVHIKSPESQLEALYKLCHRCHRIGIRHQLIFTVHHLNFGRKSNYMFQLCFLASYKPLTRIPIHQQIINLFCQRVFYLPAKGIGIYSCLMSCNILFLCVPVFRAVDQILEGVAYFNGVLPDQFFLLSLFLPA